MGFGLTFIQGKGGYTGDNKNVLFLIAERLQLAEIKNVVHSKDPEALVAIGNLS